MTLVEEALEGTIVGVGIASSRAGLSVIAHPTCAAAIWRRARNPGFASWLDALPPDQLPKARVVLRPDRVRDALEQVCDISGTPNVRERAELIDDASELAVEFANLMNAPYLRLRLDILTTNACRRFHRDAVTARMVCTYRGTGTQYGAADGGADPLHFFTVPTGSPIILRGSLWPENPHSGVLHRSPPIEGTGETRSVLVLDPVFDLDDAE